MNDPRFQKIYFVLEQFTSQQLEKILSFPDEMCFDTFNFDEKYQRFWPISVGLGVPDLVEKESFTNLECRKMIDKLGEKQEITCNPLHNVSGLFYRENRKQDLFLIINQILAERNFH